MNLIEIEINKYYVYMHIINNKVFYIGSGVSSRPFSHKYRHKLWGNYVNEIGKFTVKIHSTHTNKIDALIEEKKLIIKYKPCCNLKLNGYSGKGLKRGCSILDTETNKRYNSIKEASDDLKIKYTIMVNLYHKQERFIYG